MYNLQIPDKIHAWASKIAQETNQTVDDVLMTYINFVSEALPVLPDDEEAELAALQYLSDDALWTIAYEEMSSADKTTLGTLMDKNSSGILSEDEKISLEALVERGQKLTLRKSEAMAILTRRGHKVSLKDKS
ncbi:MAG: hypothetical protein AAFV98_18555 [Chloroflexota bacterium]